MCLYAYQGALIRTMKVVLIVKLLISSLLALSENIYNILKPGQRNEARTNGRPVQVKPKVTTINS